MTDSIQNEQARTLSKLACDDESVLILQLPDQIFGFHAQQSCEKFMKALIAAHGLKYPFVHDLNQLILELENLREALPPTPYNLLDLTPFAVGMRYMYGDTMAEEDKQLIRETVAIIHAHVVARILHIQAIP